MAHVQRLHDSGLVLAEHAMDEAAVSRALKQIRSDVALQKRDRDEYQDGRRSTVRVYKVVHIPTGRPLFSWVDIHGRPLPLSSGLVDEFQRHQLGARNSGLGQEDDYNRRLVEKADRYHRDELAAMADHYRPHLERGRLTLSFADVGKKPYWARKPKTLRGAR